MRETTTTICIFLWAFLGLFNAQAQTTFTSNGNGNWSTSFTSSGSGTPTIYVIQAGHTITCNVSGTALIDTLHVQGTLQFGNGKKIDLTNNGVVLVHNGGAITGGNSGSSFRFNNGTSINGSFSVTGPQIATNTSSGFQPHTFLPVSWVNVDAEVNNHLISLNWSTATELNNSHFVVELSKQTSEFVAVKEVKSQAESGTSNSILNYRESIELPFELQNESTLLMRIKQVDFDGKSSYSDVVVLEKDRALPYAIVQTPAQIEVSSVDGDDIEIELYNLAGNLVLRGQCGHQNLILDPKLSGMYMVVIYRKRELLGTEKVILF